LKKEKKKNEERPHAATKNCASVRGVDGVNATGCGAKKATVSEYRRTP
jgi:hypothetical protein